MVFLKWSRHVQRYVPLRGGEVDKGAFYRQLGEVSAADLDRAIERGQRSGLFRRAFGKE